MRLRIHSVAVRIGVRREIDLRAVDVQQAARFTGSEDRSLGSVDDIIGHTGHF